MTPLLYNIKVSVPYNGTRNFGYGEELSYGVKIFAAVRYMTTDKYGWETDIHGGDLTVFISSSSHGVELHNNILT